MITKAILALAFTALVAGCAPYKEESRTTSLLDARTSTLSQSATFVVAVEADGTYAGKPTPESGDMAVSAMVDALTAHASGVTAAAGYLQEAEAIAYASENGLDYLVYLRILHWEERATEWSGKPDRVEVEIRLVDAAVGDVLESQLLTANSKWMTLGGDHPQDLLVGPFNQFAADLFGVPVPENPDDNT